MTQSLNHTLVPVFALLLSGCILVDEPSGTTSTTSGGTGGEEEDDSTPTTSAEDGSSSTGDGMTMMCGQHCFSQAGLSFPYTDEPIDEDGNPVVANPVCDLSEGGTKNYATTPFVLTPVETCAMTQDEAQVVYDVAVCGEGVGTPVPALWAEWAGNAAFDAQRQCVGKLLADDCSIVGVSNLGIEELCRYFLQYPLEEDMLVTAPELDEPTPGMIESEGPCDYNNDMECGGGDGTTGFEAGGPFGDIEALVTCNGTYTSCTYQAALEDNILQNTSVLYNNGLRLHVLPVTDPNYPGVRLDGAQLESHAFDLLDAFGFENGDIIKSVNNINLTSSEKLMDAFMTLLNTGSITAKVKRGSTTTTVKAFERIR